MFSFTLPVWAFISEPATLVVLNFGAVFGVTLIKIVACDVVIVSLTSIRNGWANTPSPRFTVLKLALVDVFVFINPLPLWIVKNPAEYPLCVAKESSPESASESVAVIVPTFTFGDTNSSKVNLLLDTLGAVFG